MDSNLIKFEKARAHWWQIYCKCRQIGRALEANRDKAVSVADMHELQSPCETARQITRGLLWDYLKGCRSEERISLEEEPIAGVRITSVWLWTYFGYWLLDSETFYLYQSGQEGKQQFTAHVQLEFHQRVSTFFLQVLKETYNGVPEKSQGSLRLEELEGISYTQFARSLIFLISEYCHVDLNIPRALDVETSLRKAILSDAHWYLTRERYRDHIFHVIDVCLLGIFLLHCHLSEGQTLLALISELIHGNPDVCDDIVQNWFLAALLHDIGYSERDGEPDRSQLPEEGGAQEPQEDKSQSTREVEELNRLLSIHRGNLARLRELRARYGINVPIHIIHEIEAEEEEIRQLNTQLASWSTRKIRGTGVEHSHRRETEMEERHGEIGAQYVKGVLEALPDGSGTLLKRFEPALEAIRKHDLMEETIVFRKEPLSFLLVLCDELQEWGRAKAVSVSELREAMVSKIVFPDPSILPTNRLLESLFVGVELDEDGKYGAIPDQTLNFCLFYRDATDEQFEPLAIWLLKSHNLQRVQIAEDELKIAVVMRNPVCEDLRRIDSPDVCEFSILRDFMRDRRKWRELEDWIEDNDFVKWEPKREDKPGNRILEENVTLCLNKSAKARLLHDNPGNFLDELFEWQREYIGGRRRKI